MSGNSQPAVGLPSSRRPLPPDPGELTSMHGRVVEHLGSLIATGHLTGVLDLDDIAERFHVSRSLVRESLRTLAAKGMVRARQRTGTIVTDPEIWSLLDEQVIRWRAAGPRRFIQLRESLELRLRLEPLAARSLAARQDPASIARLKEAAQRIAQAIEEDDGPLMIAADTAFHRELYLGSGNSMLARLAGLVHGCLRVPDFQDFRQFSSNTVDRHLHFTDVICKGTPEAAEAEAQAMMERSALLFKEAYELVLQGRPPTTPQSGSAPGAHVNQPRTQPG